MYTVNKGNKKENMRVSDEIVCHWDYQEVCLIKPADKAGNMQLCWMGRIYFALQYKDRKEFSCSDFQRPVSLCMFFPHP